MTYITRLAEKICGITIGSDWEKVRPGILKAVESLLRETIEEALEDERNLRADWNYHIECLEKQLSEAYTCAAEVARTFHHIDQKHLCGLCRDIAAAIEKLGEGK